MNIALYPFCALTRLTTRHPVPFERIDLQQLLQVVAINIVLERALISLEDVGVDPTDDSVKFQGRPLSSVSVARSAIERDAYEKAERCTKVQGGVEQQAV